MSEQAPPRLQHQRGCSCPSCSYWRETDARKAQDALKMQGYVNGKPVSDETVRALWPSRKMTLAESLTHMMVEYIDGARRLPSTIAIDRESLLLIFEKRLARYISADQIAQIISEDASLTNGNLNVGYLSVKIAETIEGKRERS
jgi:hypothetical protein